MNKRLFLIYIVFLTTIPLIHLLGQDFLNSNPMRVNSNDMSALKIGDVIMTHQKTFNNKEMALLQKNIKSYNDIITTEISTLQTKRQLLNNSKQRLLQQMSAVKIQEQIDEAQRSYKEIKEGIKKNLADVGYKGLMIFVKKKASMFASTDDLKNMATISITPIAIEAINGSFLEAITEIYNRDGLDDDLYKYVKEEISGQLSVDDIYKHDQHNKDQIFWLACKVNVESLKSNIVKEEVESTLGNPDIIVINGLRENNIKQKLLDEEIPEYIADEIERIVSVNKLSVITENQAIDARRSSIISTGQLKLDEELDKISMLERKKERSYKLIEQVIEQNTSITYNPNDVGGSLQMAINEIAEKIEENYKMELHWEEKRIFVEWERNVASTGDRIKLLSNDILNVKKQFETSYGKVEQYVEINEMTNDQFTKQKGRKVVYNRKVNNLWIYLQPGASSNMILTIVATFKILDQKGQVQSNIIEQKIAERTKEQNTNHNINPSYTTIEKPEPKTESIQKTETKTYKTQTYESQKPRETNNKTTIQKSPTTKPTSNRKISIITGGKSLKSGLSTISNECAKGLESKYVLINNYMGVFTVKGAVSGWSQNNGVEFVINLGTNIGKKIVINIYNSKENKYEYIYTKHKLDANNLSTLIIEEIEKYIDNH